MSCPPDATVHELVPDSFGTLDVGNASEGQDASKHRGRHSNLVPLGKSPHPRGTAGAPNSKSRTAASPDSEPAKALNSADLVARAKREIADSGKTELWGLHIQARAVTLLVGQTSAGKTTFLHRLAFSLAEGKEFLGITPPRPLRVLYVDYESPLDVIVEHGEKIGTSPNLDFIDPDHVPKGPALLSTLEKMIRASHYDLIIVDPLVIALPVRSEDDNAEATSQMEHFRRIARDTGVGIVLVHNSGQRGERESTEDDPFFGRGATARVDRCDVGINFRKTPANRRRYLKVVKSRRSNYGARIDFEFAGDLDYRLVTSEAGGAKLERRDLGSEAARIVREERAAGRPETARKTIRERLRIEEGSAEDRALTKSLSSAVENGILKKADHGWYRDGFEDFDATTPVAPMELPDNEASVAVGAPLAEGIS